MVTLGMILALQNPRQFDLSRMMADFHMAISGCNALPQPDAMLRNCGVLRVRTWRKIASCPKELRSSCLRHVRKEWMTDFQLWCKGEKRLQNERRFMDVGLWFANSEQPLSQQIRRSYQRCGLGPRCWLRGFARLEQWHSLILLDMRVIERFQLPPCPSLAPDARSKRGVLLQGWSNAGEFDALQLTDLQ